MMGSYVIDKPTEYCSECKAPSSYLKSGTNVTGNPVRLCSWCIGIMPKARYKKIFRGTLWEGKQSREKTPK